MPDFTHLHVHTKYSLLDGASQVPGLMKKAKEDGMKAIAITDHGNMLGVPEFCAEAEKMDLLPIIGCEFYVAPRSRFEKSKGEGDDERNYYHQLLLAKNPLGYKNLSKLCSFGFIEGYYYKPRVDKELIKQYREGLIATTSCLASEVSRTIIDKGEEAGEKVFLEWKEIFGEDYYIELQRHGINEQNVCNEILKKWSKKHNVKIIATNDVHYVDLQDAEAQDILLCIQTGKDFNDPRRMRFDNDQFFFKTTQEMNKLFEDIPEAIDNTGEVVSKIEKISLKRNILLPVYNLPDGFTTPDDFLRHLTYEGAKRKYQGITEEIRNRIEFELNEIKITGYAGYFLIVQDFIAAARKLDVWVGPGRGSAASSIVAYCTGITNIDPVGYKLLFERFLTSERVSMPDIDIDFDDKGRERVIQYVVDKYGRDRVAQIVTIGTMAAKSAVKDVARTLKVPLQEANRLTKMIPFNAKSLEDAIEKTKELSDILKEQQDSDLAKTLRLATVLDGTARQTGIHAAGIIIAPNDIKEYLPVLTNKDSELYITQYEGQFVEKVGMLKMDFLGLKTLTILKEAIALIKKTRNIDIDLDKIPMDDKKTYELFQRGEMVGIFQFESQGMQAYLKELKPTNIEDLIAMNALYRPGPMDDIPSYILRKNNKEKPYYFHPLAEEILKPTFGVIVYQEQVMLISQVMAGFTRGQADMLRKAMGKKDMALLAQQKQKFIDGATAKGVDEKIANELFDKMAKFGGYGFNRAHAAAYSVLAYQTGYLKANFLPEYMASVLTNSMGDIDKLTFFIDECRKMGLNVLGPDLNKSEHIFSVTPKGEISFGVGAVKGVGEAAVAAIVKEREANGLFKDVYDLMSRVNLRSANKKTFESLIMAGAFDALGNFHRAQYFAQENGKISFLEALIRFGNAVQDASTQGQNSLFGETLDQSVSKPQPPTTAPWSRVELINKEREVAGFYISGHPLDDFKFDIDHFCTHKLNELEDLIPLKGREITIAGIVTEAAHRLTQGGKPFGSFTIEDYSGKISLMLWGDDYVKWKHYLENGMFLYVKAKVGNRFNTEVLEVKVLQISLLSSVREKLSKSITIQIPLKDVSADMAQQLSAVTGASPGTCSLKISLIDTENNMSVDLISKKIRLNLTNELLQEVKKMEAKGINMKVN